MDDIITVFNLCYGQGFNVGLRSERITPDEDGPSIATFWTRGEAEAALAKCGAGPHGMAVVPVDMTEDEAFAVCEPVSTA